MHPKAHLLCKHIEIGGRKATLEDLENPPYEHMMWTGYRAHPHGRARLIPGPNGPKFACEFPKPVSKIGGKHTHPVKLIMELPPYTRIRNICGNKWCVNPTHYHITGQYYDEMTTRFCSDRAEEKALRVTNTPLREALINNERPWNAREREVKEFVRDLEYNGLDVKILGTHAFIRE